MSVQTIRFRTDPAPIPAVTEQIAALFARADHPALRSHTVMGGCSA
ncbi:hypothetical protein ABIA39_008075 [Nocardia sp. GAS34]